MSLEGPGKGGTSTRRSSGVLEPGEAVTNTANTASHKSEYSCCFRSTKLQYMAYVITINGGLLQSGNKSLELESGGDE